MAETLGTRLGRLRSAHGWTQQELADRIALSRVAISHFEMDLAVPSERSIALLAGVFKLEPVELVAGTYYPSGKMLRLPVVVARYTEIEKQICLLERDLEWIGRIGDKRMTFDTCHSWLDQLSMLEQTVPDRHERQILAAARVRVQMRLAEHDTAD